MSRGPFLRLSGADAFEFRLRIFGCEERVPGDQIVVVDFPGEMMAALGMTPEQSRKVLEAVATRIERALRGNGMPYEQRAEVEER